MSIDENDKREFTMIEKRYYNKQYCLCKLSNPRNLNLCGLDPNPKLDNKLWVKKIQWG